MVLRVPSRITGSTYLLTYDVMTGTQISFNEFQREPEALIQSQIQAVESVFRSGWWVLGEQVQAFEQAWATYSNTTSSVGVANGMDAIEIGLRALGIGPGDEVITTAVTAFATVLAIQRCGAIPVFADIDPTTACLDPASVERCISPFTKAVLVVHLYGRAADLASISLLCSSHGIALVEDCAQAHGALYQGRRVGSIGAFGAWSFYPTKNLGSVGDAGALTSNDPDLISAARQIRNYGQSNRYLHERAGLNSRLDELHAAILLQRLPYLESWTESRRAIAARYTEEIAHDQLIHLSKPHHPMEHVHHLFVMRALGNSRARLQEHLALAGIQTLIHYPILCHQQKGIYNFRLDPLGLSSSVAHSETCFSLPIHPFLSEIEVGFVIESVNSLS